MIAFCFLTLKNIENEYFFYRFFKNNNSNIYINSKYKTKSYFENVYHYPTKNKSDISIVEATLLLLKKAFENEDNKYFVFLCGSCIPLLSFEEFKNKVEQLEYSVIKEFPMNKKERYHQLSPQFKKNYNYHQFTKQHPNMILTREDVKIFIENSYLTKHFKNMECPDEHYFINIMRLLKRDFYNHQIMFCNTDIHKTQALTFTSLDKHFIDFLKKKEYYFIRKLNLKKGNIKNLIDYIYND